MYCFAFAFAQPHPEENARMFEGAELSDFYFDKDAYVSGRVTVCPVWQSRDSNPT